VAELKCLEENYFNSQRIGAKVTKVFNEWMRKGILRPEHIKNGKFSTADLPPQCALQVLKIIGNSLKKSVVDANLQIRQTKAYFNLPEAKGLLILANDGNFALTPDLSMHVLARLFRDHFSSIDSFIYFAPRLKTQVPMADRDARLWVSGPSRDRNLGVDPELLGQISHGWISFLKTHLRQEIELLKIEDHGLVREIQFRR
jgi:hypothetical protein